ncbi:ATPase [Methanosarcina hadiensis]|uniref:ATPase n=1 Tax=Methanosarcina hadiensis TaxID=3078083 RepID=UPI003977A257
MADSEHLKRCSRCVLPETAPNITFDKDGVCNFCHSYRNVEYEGESKLKEILYSYRKDSNKYDCVVGVSGGRDSSYTLLKLVKDYKLKVLAVNYENPFTDPQARINIDNAIQALNVDVVSFKLKNNIHEKTFKHNFTSWLRKPSPATIPMMCIACKLILPNVINYAKKYDVKCVVTGGNPYEYISFKRELLNVPTDENYMNLLTKSFGIKGFGGIASEVLKNPSYCHPMCIPTMITGFLYGNPYSFGPRFLTPKINFIDIFHYIPWQEEEVLLRIKQELNWESPKRFSSSWRFDCTVSHLKDYMYMKTLSMTEKDDFYSKMVREGVITREDALMRIKEENKLHINEVQELLDSTGISIVSHLQNEKKEIILKELLAEKVR